MADGIEYLEDGRLKMIVDGKTYDCRRVTGGDFKRLNELAIRMGEADQPEVLKTIKDLEAADEELTPEQLKQYNDARVKLTNSTLEACQNWYYELLTTLSNFTGTADDIPPDFAKQEDINKILAHWTGRPLVAPGS